MLMKKNNKIGILLVLMLFVGVCGLLYPSVSQYWNTKTQSRAVTNYQEILASIKTEDYTAYFDAANKYNQDLSELSFPLLDYGALQNYEQTLNIAGNGVMGFITINKIGVELPVYHGIAAEVLNIACGHLEGTSLPIGGESTHCVLSAHRGLPHAKLFTELDKMELGDTFTITVLDRTVTYQVDQIKVVRPDEINDIQIVPGEDLCTLLTCTPYGINTHRLLVRGIRIETIVEKPVIYVSNDAFRIEPTLVMPAVAAPMLLVFLIHLMVKYREPPKKKEGESNHGS